MGENWKVGVIDLDGERPLSHDRPLQVPSSFILFWTVHFGPKSSNELSQTQSFPIFILQMFEQNLNFKLFRSLSIATLISQVSSFWTNWSVRKDRNVRKNRLLSPKWCRPVDQNWPLRGWRNQF